MKDLNTDIHALFDVIFYTGANRNFKRHQFIIRPGWIFSHALAFQVQRLKVYPLCSAIGSVIFALWLELEYARTDQPVRTELTLQPIVLFNEYGWVKLYG